VGATACRSEAAVQQEGTTKAGAGWQEDAAAVVFDSASVAYGRVPVLEDVDGVVHAGHTVALVGPNGGGKSTLIKAVLGLVPVVRGTIRVLGQEPARARRDVAYVPQADTLDDQFPVSAGQVVLMGRYRRVGWGRRPGRTDRQIATDALAVVGLAHRAADRFGTLSGGQRQRVLLARAIAQQPRLLLLDEPFNGVDAVSQEALLCALRGLRAAGTTVIVSTHDLSMAHLACDDVCLLNRHQFGFGSPAATLTPERLRAAYGGAALELRGDSVIVAQS
jgi:manganese/iron transport system ATP-binding protein